MQHQRHDHVATTAFSRPTSPHELQLDVGVYGNCSLRNWQPQLIYSLLELCDERQKHSPDLHHSPPSRGEAKTLMPPRPPRHGAFRSSSESETHLLILSTSRNASLPSVLPSGSRDVPVGWQPGLKQLAWATISRQPHAHLLVYSLACSPVRLSAGLDGNRQGGRQQW